MKENDCKNGREGLIESNSMGFQSREAWGEESEKVLEVAKSRRGHLSISWGSG